jgi:hypothetical protein
MLHALELDELLLPADEELEEATELLLDAGHTTFEQKSRLGKKMPPNSLQLEAPSIQNEGDPSKQQHPTSGTSSELLELHA